MVKIQLQVLVRNYNSNIPFVIDCSDLMDMNDKVYSLKQNYGELIEYIEFYYHERIVDKNMFRIYRQEICPF